MPIPKETVFQRQPSTIQQIFNFMTQKTPPGPTQWDEAGYPVGSAAARVRSLIPGILGEVAAAQLDPNPSPIPNALGDWLQSIVLAGALKRFGKIFNLGMKTGKYKQGYRVFHGTSHDWDDYIPDFADPMALYGPGFYTTESKKVAEGYAKARAANKLGVVKDMVYDPERARLLNLDKPMPEKVLSQLLDNLLDKGLIDKDDYKSIYNSMMYGTTFLDKISKYFPEPRPAKELWDWYLWEGIRPPEYFKEDINWALAELGFDGLTHIGGSRTGTPPHRVNIFFDPKASGVRTNPLTKPKAK